MSSSALKRIFWVTGVVLFGVGLAGWYDRLVHGHVNANYGSVVTWGLWVAAYIYFIGLSAGSFLISSLVYVFNMKRFERIGRLAVFTAVVTLFLALLSIWADLGHMTRAWHVLGAPDRRALVPGPPRRRSRQPHARREGHRLPLACARIGGRLGREFGA
jgi:protein NrfD